MKIEGPVAVIHARDSKFPGPDGRVKKSDI